MDSYPYEQQSSLAMPYSSSPCLYCGRIPYEHHHPTCPALHSSSLFNSHRQYHRHAASASSALLFPNVSVHETYLSSPTSPLKINIERNPGKMSVPQRGPNGCNDPLIPHLVSLNLQSLLRNVLESYWWYHNQLEPNDELDAFIDAEGQHRFRCSAIGCERLFSRRERAINHFRTHINHRPFACRDGACGDSSCTLAFFSQRDLHSHEQRPQVQCTRCGTVVRRQNLHRHQQSKKCQQTVRQ